MAKRFHWFEPDIQTLLDATSERRRVYVSSPFSADPDGNTKQARAYARFVHDHGYTPVVPHLVFPQFLDEETDRQAGMEHAITLLRSCDEMWVFGQMSPGMVTEFKCALAMNIPTIPMTVSRFSLDGSQYVAIAPARPTDKTRFTTQPLARVGGETK